MVKNTYVHLKTNYNKTMAIFSDIHYIKEYPYHRLKSILENLKYHNPDYICIVGDLLDQGNVLDDDICVCEFLSWLKQIAFIAPVIIVLGNHDVGVKTSKWDYQNPKKIIDALLSIPNVYVLNNESIILDSICFLGYVPPYTYYSKENQERADDYVTDIDIQLKDSICKDCYNVLLCHTPIYVTNEKIRNTKVLQSVQLVFSGHMHNGIMPFSFPGNFGIISPQKKLFPKYARGKFQLGKTNYIVSGGIITFSGTSPRIFHLFNTFFPVHIEYVQI